MRLKTPDFWYRGDGGLIAKTLAPLSGLYDFARRMRIGKTVPYDPGIPVICVGNIVAGGSGKTPAALAVMDIIRRHGLAAHPVFLTRGYGGGIKGPVHVLPSHGPADVGDEALLLLRRAPVIVSADRAAGARLAQKTGADMIVMDDGLQNPSLVKTLSLVVIDGMSAFGNGRIIPAGPLREPLETGLARADAFIVIGEDTANVAAVLPGDKPLFHAMLEADASGLDRTVPRIAFAGLGRPEKFRSTLKAAGFNIAGWRAFPDHHAYTARDADALGNAAREKSARLITTAKDAVKIKALMDESLFDVLPVALKPTDEDQVLSLFHAVTGAR